MIDISEQSGKQYPSGVFVLSIFSGENMEILALWIRLSNMSHDARNSVFGISDQVQHKRSVQSQKQARSLSFWKRNCTICVSKTKVLISCAVTA